MGYWDLEYTHETDEMDEAGEAVETTYRIRAKSISVIDATEISSMQLKLAERMGIGEFSDTQSIQITTLIQHFPLIVFGTQKTEGIDIPTTEDEFWALPSALMLQWSEVIRERNPQYNFPFSITLNQLTTHLATKKQLSNAIKMNGTNVN